MTNGSGKRLLVDTNALILALSTRADILKEWERADWVGMSVVSFIEYLGFPRLTA